MSPTAERQERSQRWAAFFFLASLLLGLGFFIVPAHWTSIWGDREFTDWVSPIANRLQDGARLYDSGLHNPIPPLSFVLVRVLFPDGAVWLQENLLNYAFQSAMILLLFLAFSREVRASIALAAALAAIPIFLSLPKTILYDSMAQFLVVVCALAGQSLVRQPVSAATKFLLTGGLGLALALLLLTKQSTAAGALAGVLAALLLYPQESNLRQRARLAAIVMLCTVACFCAIALALGHYLSFPGMLRDAFLTASEVKGGTGLILRNLLVYVLQIGLTFVTVFCLYQILHRVLTGTSAAWRPPLFPPEPQLEDRRTPATGESFLLLTAIGSCLLGLAGEFLLVAFGQRLPAQFFETAWANLLLNLGLMACLFVAARRGRNLLSVYALVFILAAVSHNLSVNSWRWSYYNNPLVYLALVFVFGAVLSIPSSTRRPWLSATLVAFGLIAMWPLAADQIHAIRQCREPWPEVRQLAGARLRPEAAGMRSLVQTVRSLVNSSNGETVLLLPNDPNVEAWFERDRPQLSSAIIFTDQFWDRFVDDDFAALRAHPPKVIVIGPVRFWREFSRKWNRDRGAERLIDLVQTRMLSQDYELRLQQSIGFQGGTDVMRVYVRRSGAGPEPEPHALR